MSKSVPCFDRNLLTCINNRKRMAEAKSIIQKMKNAHKLITDNNCSTLLHYAAKYGNNKMTEYLIELGSDVNAKDLHGRTPLMCAVKNKLASTVRILLDNNANIHIPDKHGKSPLQEAVHGRPICHATIQAFMNKLKRETSCYDSRTLAQKLRKIDCPLRVAVFLDDADVTRLMVKGGGCKVVDSEPGTGETALHVAVRLLSLENVKLLIQFRANLDAQNTAGYTPLHYLDVNKDGSFEILKILLDQRAMMFTEEDGETRCQIRCILKRAGRKIIHLLMQYDVDLRAVDEHGNTALHYLAENKYSGVFDELQGKEFDVNARNKEMYTPLLLDSDNLSSLKFLVNSGADVNASRDGVTPLIQIFQKPSSYRKKLAESVASVNILLCHGADPQYLFLDRTMDDYPWGEESFVLFQPVLAHLALLDEEGRLIASVRGKINRYDLPKNYYKLCKLKLNSMKKITVWESVTKYKLLVVSEKQLAKYARQREFRSVVSSNTFCFESCYEHFGRERVGKAVSTAELWRNSALVLCVALKLAYEKYYNVIEDMIINYLSERDLRNLCLLVEK